MDETLIVACYIASGVMLGIAGYLTGLKKGRSAPECSHHWAVLHRIERFTDENDEPSKFIYVLQCEACGDLKTKEV